MNINYKEVLSGVIIGAILGYGGYLYTSGKDLSALKFELENLKKKESQIKIGLK